MKEKEINAFCLVNASEVFKPKSESDQSISLEQQGAIYDFRVLNGPNGRAGPFIDLENRLCTLFAESPRYIVTADDCVPKKTIRRGSEGFMEIDTSSSKTRIILPDSKPNILMGGLMLMVYAPDFQGKSGEVIYMAAPHFKDGKECTLEGRFKELGGRPHGRTRSVDVPFAEYSEELTKNDYVILFDKPFDRNCLWLMAGAYFMKDSMLWKLFYKDVTGSRAQTNPGESVVLDRERLKAENARLNKQLRKAKERLMHIHRVGMLDAHVMGKIENTIDFSTYMGQLQLIEEMERTGKLIISSSTDNVRGTFYFSNGRIVQAKFEDSTGIVTGEEAIRKSITAYVKGKTPMKYGFIPSQVLDCSSVIDSPRSVRAELMDCMRELDDENQSF